MLIDDLEVGVVFQTAQIWLEKVRNEEGSK